MVIIKHPLNHSLGYKLPKSGTLLDKVQIKPPHSVKKHHQVLLMILFVLGVYIHVEASAGKPGDTAIVLSDPVLATTNEHCISFWYHMHGADIDEIQFLYVNRNKTYRRFTFAKFSGKQLKSKDFRYLFDKWWIYKFLSILSLHTRRNM